MTTLRVKNRTNSQELTLENKTDGVVKSEKKNTNLHYLRIFYREQKLGILKFRIIEQILFKLVIRKNFQIWQSYAKNVLSVVFSSSMTVISWGPFGLKELAINFSREGHCLCSQLTLLEQPLHARSRANASITYLQIAIKSSFRKSSLCFSTIWEGPISSSEIFCSFKVHCTPSSPQTPQHPLHSSSHEPNPGPQ